MGQLKVGGKVLRCPGCGSEDLWKKGVVPSRQGQKVRYICTDCGRSFFPPVEVKKPRKSKASAVRGEGGKFKAGHKAIPGRGSGGKFVSLEPVETTEE